MKTLRQQWVEAQNTKVRTRFLWPLVACLTLIAVLIPFADVSSNKEVDNSVLEYLVAGTLGALCIVGWVFLFLYGKDTKAQSEPGMSMLRTIVILLLATIPLVVMTIVF